MYVFLFQSQSNQNRSSIFFSYFIEKITNRVIDKHNQIYFDNQRWLIYKENNQSQHACMQKKDRGCANLV